MATNLRDTVFQGLGEASMCWSTIPTGEFDSTHAACVGDEIMQAIEEQQPTALAIEAVKGLLTEALQVDGAHHKQYLLWRIAEVFDLDLSAVSDDKGIAP